MANAVPIETNARFFEREVAERELKRVSHAVAVRVLARAAASREPAHRLTARNVCEPDFVPE